MDYYYIMNNVFKLENLSTIFSDMVEKGDHYVLHFPGGDKSEVEDPRKRGLESFQELDGVQVLTSPYFKDGVAIEGAIDIKSKNLFYKYFSLAKGANHKDGLNHFSLYRDEKLIFEIQNFKVGYILCSFYDEEERAALGLNEYEPFVL